MNILVVCQYYYPEPVRITNICEELVKQGNKVTVLTDIPNYPEGNLYSGYEKKKKRKEVINGVNIYRCYTVPRKKGIFKRMLNYYSYSFFSTKMIKKLSNEFDVVFVNQLSPVLMAKAAIKYKKKYNKKIVLYCLDIWPESLCAGGIKKDSLIYNHYKKVSKKIYDSCDKILVTSKSFFEYFDKMFNINGNKIDYLPQYAEDLFEPSKCKKAPNDTIDLLFAGNIGQAQSIDTILDSAKELKNIKNLFFYIVGDGSQYDYCKNKIEKENITNVIMYGRRPIEEMPDFYKKADAMLVTLCGDSMISYTLPGKVQSYMAAGKPIIGSANGETKEIIEDAKCGFCGKADDVKELTKNIKKFINYKEKEKLGINSRKYYEKNFLREKFNKKLIEELKDGVNNE